MGDDVLFRERFELDIVMESLAIFLLFGNVSLLELLLRSKERSLMLALLSLFFVRLRERDPSDELFPEAKDAVLSKRLKAPLTGLMVPSLFVESFKAGW